MSISGLGYVAFNVSDMDSWTRILTRVFGMQVIDESLPGVRHFRLDDWHHRITLYETEVDSVAAVGWELRNEDELTEMVRRLQEAGVFVSEADAGLHDERKVTSLYRFIDPASTMPTEIFFGAEIHDVKDSDLGQIFADVPNSRFAMTRLTEGLGLIDALVECGLCRSKSDARRMIGQGSIYINNRRCDQVDYSLRRADLASESSIVLRAGKKRYGVLRFE